MYFNMLKHRFYFQYHQAPKISRNVFLLPIKKKKETILERKKEIPQK